MDINKAQLQALGQLRSYPLFADTPSLESLEAKARKKAEAGGHKLGDFTTIENEGRTYRSVGCLLCGTGITLGIVKGEEVMVGDALQPCRPTHPG